MKTSAHVVIVGAGFGGISAAHELSRSGYQVTVIDKNPYTTFLPLLYQVATGGVNPGDVTYSLRLFAARQKRHPRIRRATVTGINKARRIVEVDDGPDISYDYLIIATGVTANHFGIPGAAEYTRSIYTRTGSIEVRDMIYGGMEDLADTGRNKFSVVVVGGGPTGVEMAGTLAEMKTLGIPAAYPELTSDQMDVVLVEMAGQLLTPFDKSLQDYTYQQLEDRQVDIRLNTAISEVRADKVIFTDGSELDADLVIWAAGIGAYDAVREWGLPQGRGGRIEVAANMLVVGEERIYAIGDCAVITTDPLPQLAQPAIQQGKFVAREINRRMVGEAAGTFKYNDKGTMATIGRASAVAEFPFGLKVKGILAWLLWLAVHLFFLLGNRNRIMSMINLATRYVFQPKASATIVGDPLDPPSEEALVDAKQAADEAKQQARQVQAEPQA